SLYVLLWGSRQRKRAAPESGPSIVSTLSALRATAILDARDIRLDVRIFRLVHFHDSAAQMAAAPAVEEINQEADRAPYRQEQHRRGRQVGEQQDAANDRQRRDDPECRNPEAALPARILTTE